MIITLISDWRLRDPYVAMLKGRLLTTHPDANIIDISHHIDFFNVAQSAFIMKNSYQNFPEGSIHLMLTNTAHTATAPAVLLEHDGHYFIGQDNGVFFLMFGMKGPLQGRRLFTVHDTTVEGMFHLVQAIHDGNLHEVTEEYHDFERTLGAEPIHIAPQRSIEGEIVYIDAAFNAITNIPTAMFKEAVHGGTFKMTVHSKTEWKIEKFFEHYSKTEGMFLTNNALHHIQISMYQGEVSLLASLSVGDKVEIEY
ncbi:MAG: SAM-dependent chlorinase/fluorinase [Bacteroidales bacterium]|nr:SAM-dependent chlorinase/fluorinase [Bacteroidales bacterium]